MHFPICQTNRHILREFSRVQKISMSAAYRGTFPTPYFVAFGVIVFNYMPMFESTGTFCISNRFNLDMRHFPDQQLRSFCKERKLAFIPSGIEILKLFIFNQAQQDLIFYHLRSSAWLRNLYNEAAQSAICDPHIYNPQ